MPLTLTDRPAASTAARDDDKADGDDDGDDVVNTDSILGMFAVIVFSACKSPSHMQPTCRRLACFPEVASYCQQFLGCLFSGVLLIVFLVKVSVESSHSCLHLICQHFWYRIFRL